MNTNIKETKKKNDNKDVNVKNINVNTKKPIINSVSVKDNKFIMHLITDRILTIGNNLHSYFINFKKDESKINDLFKESIKELNNYAKKLGGKCIVLNETPIDYYSLKRIEIQFNSDCEDKFLWEICDEVNNAENKIAMEFMEAENNIYSYLDDTYYESGDND